MYNRHKFKRKGSIGPASKKQEKIKGFHALSVLLHKNLSRMGTAEWKQESNEVRQDRMIEQRLNILGLLEECKISYRRYN